MSRKKPLFISISAALLVVVAVMATVLTAETEGALTEEKIESTGESAEFSAPSEKEAAEDLIGTTVSREEIQVAVGEWEKFEMSSNGCERGVYAGRFYYKDFIIFSRTYDKGNTFRVVSIN